MAKRTGQNVRVYVADNQNPDSPGDWTLISSLRLESLELKSGSTPSEALFSESVSPETGTFKAQHVPPATETAETGNGQMGSLFCGADVTENDLLKVEIEGAGGGESYSPVFFGVVAEMKYDLGRAALLIRALDYRFFLQRTPVYGRLCHNPHTSPQEFFIRSGRTTFNADGEPDRGQSGALGSSGAYDTHCFAAPRYNRDESTPGPVESGQVWADFWTLGHVWNYLREVYCANTPGELGYLGDITFLDWPEASEEPSGELHFLFEEYGGKANTVRDLAITGLSLAEALDQLVRRAGPYDWTLVPNAGSGAEYGIEVFSTVDGLGTLDYEWGQVGQAVSVASPRVLGGELARRSLDRFDRALGIGRRKVYEITLSTEDDTLVPGWDPDAQSDWVSGWAGGDPGAASTDYQGVFLRWHAPDDLDWGAEFFGGAEAEGGGRSALRTLLSWAQDEPAATGAASRRVRLRPIVWRKRTDISGASWEKLPAQIALGLLPDVCGFQLGGSARNVGDGVAWPDDAPWSWDGNTGSPVTHEIRITLAVEADERVLAEVDNTPSGARAREHFLDGGNTFAHTLRSDAVIPTDDGTTAGQPVLDLPAGGGDATFSGVSTIVNETADLQDILDNRLAARDRAFVGGTLLLSGLAAGGSLPFPVGYRVGQLEVSASGDRPALDINACVGFARLDVRADTTTLGLDGRR